MHSAAGCGRDGPHDTADRGARRLRLTSCEYTGQVEVSMASLLDKQRNRVEIIFAHPFSLGDCPPYKAAPATSVAVMSRDHLPGLCHPCSMSTRGELGTTRLRLPFGGLHCVSNTNQWGKGRICGVAPPHTSIVRFIFIHTSLAKYRVYN